MFKKIRKFKNSKRRSTGSVCVEFAFVAPIFFLLVIGSIEFARIHMIQSAVENACFEGARRGIVPCATNELCKQRTEQFLQSARVTDFDVVVEPEVIDSLTEEITVTTTVTLNAKNGFGISGFFKDRSMTKQVSLATQ